jgi:hypothetical protein
MVDGSMSEPRVYTYGWRRLVPHAVLAVATLGMLAFTKAKSGDWLPPGTLLFVAIVLAAMVDRCIRDYRSPRSYTLHGKELRVRYRNREQVIHLDRARVSDVRGGAYPPWRMRLHHDGGILEVGSDLSDYDQFREAIGQACGEAADAAR